MMNIMSTNQNVGRINDDKFLKISTVIWMFVGLCFFFVAIRSTAGFFVKSMFMDYMESSLDHGRSVSKPIVFMFSFLHFLLTGGLVNEITFGTAGVNIFSYFDSAHTAVIIRGIIFLFLSFMCTSKILAQSGKILSGNTSFQTSLSWITSIACILFTPLLIVPGIIAIIGTVIDRLAKKK